MSGSLLSVCERTVARALQRGAEAAEVYARRERGGTAELEKGMVSAAEWNESAGFGVRLVRDSRVGFAYASLEDGLDAAIDGALRATRLGKRLPRFAFPGPAKAPRGPSTFDARVAALEAEDLLDFGGRILDAVVDVRKDLLVAGGAASASAAEAALANSEGLARTSRETGLGAHVFVVQRRDGVSTGFATAESTRLDLDWAGAGAQAGRLAVASARPAKLEGGGRISCVVRPEPASELLGTVTIPSLYGKPAHRGESYYSNRVGRRVMHEKVSLVDDPSRPRGLGTTAFDDEGVPTRPRRLVARGLLKTFLYDVYDAAEWARKTTANAVRQHPLEGTSYKSPPGTSALQVRLEAPRARMDRLVASLDEGLVLHDMMGVHTANAVSGDFSVTSSVLFRVRRGDIEGPLAPLSVAGNVHAALRTGVRLGDDVKRMGGAPAWELPSVLFEGFTVTP